MKKIPDLFIYPQHEKGGKASNNRVGVAFQHNKGGGYNILIGEDRYVAFPPRPYDAEGGA